VNFQLKDQKILSRMTLAETEKLLPSYFCKTHRSFLVNTQKIQKLEKHQVTLDNKTAPVSNSFYEALIEELK